MCFSRKVCYYCDSSCFLCLLSAQYCGILANEILYFSLLLTIFSPSLSLYPSLSPPSFFPSLSPVPHSVYVYVCPCVPGHLFESYTVAQAVCPRTYSVAQASMSASPVCYYRNHHTWLVV